MKKLIKAALFAAIAASCFSTVSAQKTPVQNNTNAFNNSDAFPSGENFGPGPDLNGGQQVFIPTNDKPTTGHTLPDPDIIFIEDPAIHIDLYSGATNPSQQTTITIFVTNTGNIELTNEISISSNNTDIFSFLSVQSDSCGSMSTSSFAVTGQFHLVADEPCQIVATGQFLSENSASISAQIQATTPTGTLVYDDSTITISPY